MLLFVFVFTLCATVHYDFLLCSELNAGLPDVQGQGSRSLGVLRAVATQCDDSRGDEASVPPTAASLHLWQQDP